MDKPSQTSLKNKKQLVKPQQDLWMAVRTVLSLQSQFPELLPASRGHHLPLSFSQERLWLLHQLEPDSSTHNIPFAFQISGFLNLDALEQSLHEVWRRHEALRTTFSIIGDRPYQIISSETSFTLTQIDLKAVPAPQQNQQVSNLINKEAAQPFDLSQGPLFRASLLCLAADQYILLLTVHHIAFDGWSEGILFRELSILYDSLSQNQPSSIAPLPIQYADFALWQRQCLQGEFQNTLLSYWKQQLENIPSKLQLPIEYPPTQLRSNRSACQPLTFSIELTKSLKALSRQEGATLFVLLLTAFKVFLYRYTAQEDLFVCSPVANRNRSDVKQLIGYFVNLLVLRTDLSGNPSFQELLARVRQVVSAAYAYQDLPVQQLVSQSNAGSISLSQILFVLQNTPRHNLELSGLSVRPLAAKSDRADFDLSVSLFEESGRLKGALKYNADLFNDSTILQMGRRFQTLLEQVVANPAQSLSLLLPLSDIEQEELKRKREDSGRKLSYGSGLQGSYVAPRNYWESLLTQLWEQTLGIKPIGIRDNFFDLGGESLQAVTLFNQMEKTTGVNLPLATLIQAPTIEKLAKLISQGQMSGFESSLVPLQTQGTEPPFFCIHGKGANVLIFKRLAEELGSNQPFYGLQAKGLDGKQAPLRSVEEMASHYIQEIRNIQPHGPYYLGGFSFGGIVAFEIAQQLLQGHEKVALVALLDTYGPGCFKKPSFSQRLLRHYKNCIRLGPKYLVKMIYSRLKKSRRALTCRLYRYQGRILKGSLLRGYIGELIAQAEKQYVFKPYPGKLTLFRASHPPAAAWYYRPGMPTPDDWCSRDPDHGWRPLAEKGLEIYNVPGNHSSMFKDPYVEDLARLLKECMKHKQHLHQVHRSF